MERFWTIPAIRFSAVLAIGSLLVGLAIQLAVQQRGWGDFAVGDRLQLSHGWLEIEELDLTPEPGGIISDEALSRFYSRQQQLAEWLSAPTLIVERQGNTVMLQKQDNANIKLPTLFWVQLLVGLGALIISGWVWSLRAGDKAAGWFGLSGVATLLFTVSAAIYTTRELALPEALFRWLVGANVFGASLFGIAMIALFLCYPLPLRRWRGLLIAQVMLFGLWTGLSLAGQLPAWAGVNLITLVEMLVIVAALIAQFVVTKGNPAARASLSWLGLAVLAGAGGFIALNALPLVLGSTATVEQGVAFVFFLVIYLGLAAGITRYRLFEVGSWAFTFLFYSLGAFLLVLLDAALIFLVGLDRLPALGLSFFAIGLLYLPMRDFLQRFLRRVPQIKTHELLDAVMQVALAPSSHERERNWQVLIQQLFDPLDLLRIEDPSRVVIGEDGIALSIPQVAGVPAMQLKYPQSGKALFSRESKHLAQQLVVLVERAVVNRDAYEKGVAEERVRIARDLHDDVGARLLNGLHADEKSLRAIIQEAMADIRSIVRGITGEAVLLADCLADVRAESMNRADTAGLIIEWPIQGYENSGHRIDYRIHKALGSMLRELLSNTLRHASARKWVVEIHVNGDALEVSATDDGKGFPENVLKGESGFGLNGIRERVRGLNGECSIKNTENGANVTFCLPLK